MFQPTRFGEYLLVERLARGGMAEIFLAKLCGAEGFEKELVIKKILPEWSANRDFLSMLIDEAKLAVQLAHANIVQVHELGQEGGDYYIAMEYVNGIDLRRLWEKMADQGKRLPLEITTNVILNALEGLSFAHTRRNAKGVELKIVHRDISPQNILISFDGEVKITDFGIAKAALRTTETASGVHKGKFSYMSPEQANLEEVDPSSDLFALGIVFFELLTGRRLFGGVSDIETLDRIRRAEITFTGQEERETPKELRQIVLKALQRDLGQRYPSAAAFQEDLHRFVSRQRLSLRRERLATFLQELFREEIGEARRRAEQRAVIDEEKYLPPVPHDDTRVLVAPQPQFLAQTGTKKLKPLIIPGLAALLLIIVIASLFLTTGKKRAQSLTPQHPPKGASPPRIERPAQAVVIPPVSETKTIPQQGMLSVMVIPWGSITIDGGPKKEAPVKGLPLKEGPHQITAIHGPDGLPLSTSISLNGGQHLRCLANFETPPLKIQCR